MIHEEICTYEVSKLAKEKGFDGLCYAAYDREGVLLPNDIPNPNMRLLLTDCIAPTQSLLQRWLREEKKVEVYVSHFEEIDIYPHHFGTIITDDKGETLEIGGKMFDTYELALEYILKYALENLV